MNTMFEALFELLRSPLDPSRGVKTDSSVVLVYSPEQELDFRDHLHDKFLPRLRAQGLLFRSLDLSGFLFEDLPDESIEDLSEDEFEDYRWMKQGLSRRMEAALAKRLGELAAEVHGGSVIAWSTISLFPLVRYGEILRDLRDLPARVVLAFPGEDRGGKLHYMNQPDGGNYLAVKLSPS
jgi:hypothetical protein